MNKLKTFVVAQKRLLSLCSIICLLLSSQCYASAGCGNTNYEQGTRDKGINVWGRNYIYRLVVPENYNPNEQHILYFGFHGMNWTGVKMRELMQGQERLAAGKAIFVYPTSRVASQGWNRAENGPDVALFDSLYDFITKTYCINEKSVFAAGHSNGAYFINSLAQVRHGKLSAIVSVSGAIAGAKMQNKIPAIISHGTNDEYVGYKPNAVNTVKSYAWMNCCDMSSISFTPYESCRYVARCDAAFPVLFCSWSGRHDWPRFQFADEQIWQFLEGLNKLSQTP